MTTRERTEKVSPLEKFVVLAGDIDRLRNQVENISLDQTIDELLEIIEVQDLAKRFGVSVLLMKKKLRAAGGSPFKLGKKWVIRKVGFLEVLQHLEQDG
ncbi:MAG: hypothetical protein L7T84_04855 [Akkermansiaceae bacterium]|nr:hypothetical protein [Akkermansiaceae bacterium]